ncbi:MAG: hypothetical protein JEY99_05460 [Spirochaetales bacterium]|nr:hypothetical protein [Spirochaetales bacterium]
MAMTGKERVSVVFEGDIPDRVPRWCGASEEFWLKAKNSLGLGDEPLRQRMGDDFRRVSAEYKLPQVEFLPGATYCSPFGVQRKGIGYGMPMSHPLKDVETLLAVEAYSWPDASIVDVSAIRGEAESWKGVFSVLGGEWSPFWHDAIDLVGHEDLYYKMYDHPNVVKKIFEKITDFYIAGSVKAFDEASDLMDIFFIGNDFGSQNGPLMGLEMFREFILPSLKRLVNLGHDFGLKVMLHCCGSYREFITDLVAIGMDGLHALQPDAANMNPVDIKRDFGGKIVLNGAIDSHHILINSESPWIVKEQTRKLLEIMMPGGRYIGGASHDTILEETPVENVLAMMDAIEEFGVYKA